MQKNIFVPSAGLTGHTPNVQAPGCTYERDANGVHWITTNASTYYAIREMCQYILYIGQTFTDSPSRIVVDTQAVTIVLLRALTQELQDMNEQAMERTPSRMAMVTRRTAHNSLIQVVVRSALRPRDQFEVFSDTQSALAWVKSDVL